MKINGPQIAVSNYSCHETNEKPPKMASLMMRFITQRQNDMLSFDETFTNFLQICTNADAMVTHFIYRITFIYVFSCT